MAKQKVRGFKGKEMSQAFLDKSEQELKTLRTSVATTLQNDMLRLLEEDLHTDLIFVNGTDKVKAHTSIVQCRLRESWRDSWLNKHNNLGCYTIEVKGISTFQLCSLVRQLYTVSDAALLVEEFLPFFPGSKCLKEIAAEEVSNTSTSPDYERHQPLIHNGSQFHGDNLGGEASDSNSPTASNTEISIGPDISSELDVGFKGADILATPGSPKNESHASENKSCLNIISDTEKPKTLNTAMNISHETCSSLGRDLLQMYLNQENCDCCIVVEGQKFPAHKSILSARSEYFEAMLGGHWVESHLDVVSLEGVSPQAVSHLLLFLYGGVIDLPINDVSSDLLDLFQVADMYGVSTLNKVLSFYLRRDLCHFFHKPCSSCALTAADALSLCHNFNLEDLEQRTLKWIAKNFTKIWPSKTFAGLPDNLQQISLRSLTSQFTPMNVLDIIVECDRLTSSLPRVKWTEAVLCLLTQLMDAAIEFTSSNFVRVIKNPEFLQWAQGATWKASTLQHIFISAIDSLPIDKACHVFQTMLQIQATVKQDTNGEHESRESSQVGEEVTGLLEAMVQRCERFLRMHIHKVMRSSQWSELPKPVQGRIMETSAYLSLADLPEPKPKPAAKKPVSVRHVAPPRPMPALESNRPRARVTPPRAPLGKTRVLQGGVTLNSSTQSPHLRNQQTSQMSGLGLGQVQTSTSRQCLTGARPKSNTEAKAVVLSQKEEKSNTCSGRHNQDLHQVKSCGKVQKSSESQEENREMEIPNNLNSDSDDISSNLACSEDNSHATNFENILSRETGTKLSQPQADYIPDTLPDLTSLQGDSLDKALGSTKDIKIDDSESLNSTKCFVQPFHCSEENSFFLPQNTFLDNSDVSQMGITGQPEHSSNAIGVEINPDFSIIQNVQSSTSSEPSPKLQTSRLPVAQGSSVSRSPRPRWSLGSSETLERHYLHHNADDAQVINVLRPDVLRSMSLPPEGQGTKRSGPQGSAMGTGTSLDPTSATEEIHFPPGEVKIVKMSRPLSIGFVVPSS